MRVKENDIQSEEGLADRALRVSTQVAEAMFPVGSIKLDVEKARLLGKNVLKEELGAHSEPSKGLEPYNLTASKRDSLLAHTRQDVAMIYGLTVATVERCEKLDRQVKGLRNFALLQVLVLILLVISKIW